MRHRATIMRARATSLLMLSGVLALVLAAPVVAASRVDVTSGVFDALRGLGDQAGDDATTMSARAKVYRRTGIDVSHWQGFIDWDRVAASGVDFAIVKATEGADVVDAWYLRNRNRARRAGILVTAYHFAHPGLTGRGERLTRDRARRPDRGSLLPASCGPATARPHPGAGPGTFRRAAAKRAADLDDDLPAYRQGRRRGEPHGLQHRLVLASTHERHGQGRPGRLPVLGRPLGHRDTRGARPAMARPGLDVLAVDRLRTGAGCLRTVSTATTTPAAGLSGA